MKSPGLLEVALDDGEHSQRVQRRSGQAIVAGSLGEFERALRRRPRHPVIAPTVRGERQIPFA